MLDLLVVCTGNICRSPAAHLLLAAELDGTVAVSSAGTRAVVGAPVAEPVARRLSAVGVAPVPFAARALTRSLVDASDVVVTMTAAHRAAVLELSPGALRRTFLLTELVTLAERTPDRSPREADDAARLRAVVASAGRTRATLGGARAADVEDPFGRPEDVHSRVFAHVREQVAGLTAALRG